MSEPDEPEDKPVPELKPEHGPEHDDDGKPRDSAEDDPTDTFAENEPTHSSGREPLSAALPGDLPPEALAAAFDTSDEEDTGERRFTQEAQETVKFEREPPPDLDEVDPVAPKPSTDLDLPSPHLTGILESLLFVADKPIALQQLGDLVGENDLSLVREAVASLEAHYYERGIQLHQVAGGYQFRTNPKNANWVTQLLQQKPVRLSRALLETLAIVSYRQPITRPEIDEIRGVDSGGTLKTLMDRSLVRILGKKEEPGRPMLYGTTKDFLEFFNLKDLKDLPTLREFHELSEEHRAQVEALEAAAPEGSVETEEEARAAAQAARPLERVELKAAVEDTKELEEIDRLIEKAGEIAAAATPKPEEPEPGA
jgi:segregation and condensation protein B